MTLIGLRMRHRFFVFALAALSLGAVRLVSAQAPPDLILYRGRIITVDAIDRVVQAIAITGNTITAVGSDAEITELAGPATRRIDLGGRAVTPGLLDAHAVEITDQKLFGLGRGGQE